MTDDVAELVLVDNYRQGEAITLLERNACLRLEDHARFMRALQRDGKLDREIENLPDDEELAVRAAAQTGLTRPELAVLMAYGKMTLSEDLLDSDLPGDDYLVADLLRGFPKQLRKKYRDGIATHPLRGELIATLVANSLVNRAGPSFYAALASDSGAGAGGIGRAYVIVRDAFDLRHLWRAIGELDNQVSAEVQSRMLEAISALLRRACAWFLNRSTRPGDIGSAMAGFQPGITELCSGIEPLLADYGAEAYGRRLQELVADRVPEWLAGRIAGLEPLASACDIVSVANEVKCPVTDVGRVYFALGARLGLDWLRAAAEGMTSDDHWDRLAITAVVEDLFGQQGALALAALGSANGNDAVAAWTQEHGDAVARCNELIEDLKAAGNLSVAKLTYANRRLRSLISD